MLYTDSLPPPPLSGRGKYQSKLPSVLVFHFGIAVGIFLLYDLAGTPFEDFTGTLFWKFGGNSFFSQKEGEVYKRGPKPPPFLWEKGAPANFKIPNLPTEFPFGIRYENTEKIPKGSYPNTKSVSLENMGYEFRPSLATPILFLVGVRRDVPYFYDTFLVRIVASVATPDQALAAP